MQSSGFLPESGEERGKTARPVIGVLPLFDEEKDSYWMLPGYMELVRAAGAIPVILPLELEESEFLQLDRIFSGYLFTGGHDVDPSLYGEKAHGKLGPLCTERDILEKMIYEHCVRIDKPVLGICRGLQYINVLEGGSLYQDLLSQRSETAFTHAQKPPYDEYCHQVLIEKESRLYAIAGKEVLAVNSCHHQGIKDLAPALSVMARAFDGLIEAVERKDKKCIMAVQWHPEFNYKREESSRRLMEYFVDKCR